VNVENKEQAKQHTHTHSANKPKKFKQTFSTGKLMAAVSWNRNPAKMLEFMQQGITTT
jgi:hypothetical protein